MSPPAASMPTRTLGSHRRSGRRLTALFLCAAFAAGCSAKKSPPPATPPVEQLPPPILTPTGVPTGSAAGGTIGPAGGTLQAPDGRLSLVVPAGAVATDTPFTVQPVVNTALGGVGGAFRIRPEGVVLAKPVTLVLAGPDSYQSGADIEGLGISYQDATGFWYPVKGVTRDVVKNTLTVTTDHFSDWGVTWQAGVPGLYGAFTLDQTVELPFTAAGNATLFYQGSNTTKTLYVLTGDLAVPASIPYQGATCAPALPAQTMSPSVAELWNTPSQFRWSINGQWDLTCTQTGGGTTPQFISVIFDTLGINLIGCTRGYVGTPTLGADRVTGTYLIDCGTRGHVQASWDFIACVPGVQCAGPNPCTFGAIDCSTGNPVCADTGTPIPSGTSCGTDLVCNAGTCSACVAGDACTTQPDTLCHAGVHDCSTGTQACVNGAALANGTSCGTDQVCNAGTCSACVAGDACTTPPDPLCHAGVHDCSTGVQACVNGAALTDGTSCGTDQVCSGGACSACTANLACATQPDTLCHAGVTSCATGSSQCVNGAPLANGTVCGVDQACSGGACLACAANQVCLTQPDTLCHTGTTDCSTGSLACVNGAALANGSSCGTNQVCSAGACVACVAGDACTTQPDPLCHAGVHDCSTGTQACVNGAALANGTSCGTDQVCSAGTCSACAAGQACTTQPDTLCHAGITDCSTGTMACLNGALLPNGTSCGAGSSCNAGACVASRTVSGTRLLTLWPDTPPDPVSAPAPDVLTATVAAVVPDGQGGWVTYPGAFDLAGNFTVANVPAGTYWLSFTDGAGQAWFFQTSASSVDLGYDLVGRASPALAAATGATPVTIDFTNGGLDPWDVAGDQLQLSSSGADLWDPLLSAGALAAGATSGSAVEDWFASAAGRPLDLLAPADVLAMHQLHGASATSTPDGTVYTYVAATRASTQAGVTLTDGGSLVSITFPALVAPATSGSLAVDWTLPAFEALQTSMVPAGAAGTSTYALTVGASARTLAWPAPRSRAAGAPTLLQLRPASGAAAVTFAVPLPYGHALDPATWIEWREAALTAHADFTTPGATAPVRLDVTLGQREPMSPAPTVPIVPLLGPIQLPQVNGAAATAPLTGVGLTPTLAWTAPATGTPTSYSVELYRLDASGPASTAIRVVTLVTTGTSLRLPPGVLASGSTYLAMVTARAVAGEAPATAPLRTANVFAWASAVTSTFVP